MSANVSFALIDISADDDLSTAVDCKMGIPLAIQCPAALTSTTLTIYASANTTDQDGTAFTTYGLLKDISGNTVTKTFVANAVLALDPTDWAGVRSFKIATNSNEAADRRFAIVWRND